MSIKMSYISFQDVHFYYNKKNIVLNGINMDINKGDIFAMLGANGNGKTTLIKLLVGVLRPLSGRILINGKEPGSKGLDVPGRMVGYMPQETALYTNLTIEQVFNYYGYIFGMSNKQIEERIRYLYANMDLKEKHKTIGTLSGGQQRSVSMALTLIHSPELVIWDEPTVGLDPIKRDRMWRFLFDMCRNQGLTVLITTHYIEEAKQANQVAFIYRGLCLEQNTPFKLLDKYDCCTLEEVSYLACRNFDKLTPVITEPEVKNKSFLRKRINLSVRGNHMKALLWKMICQFRGNFTMIVIFLLLPVLTLTLPILAFGSPKHIRVGVLDADQTNLTRSFINSLDKQVMTVGMYDQLSTGINKVERGKNMMFAEIPEGFTERMQELSRGEMDDDLEDENNTLISTSTAVSSDEMSVFLNKNSRNDSIKLYVDMTNVVPAYYTVAYTLRAFMKALRNNPDLFGGSTRNTGNMFAMKFEEPVYGSFDTEYKDNMTCGDMVVLVVNASIFLTAFALNNERLTGVKYRDRVTGITKLESVISVFIFSMLVNLVGIAAQAITIYYFLESLANGSLFQACLLLFLVGAVGSLIGILLALALRDNIMIAMFGFALQVIIMILCGAMWPVETYPTWLKELSLALPFTRPISSLQSLLISGLSIASPKVMSGFIIASLYLLLLLVFNFGIIVF